METQEKELTFTLVCGNKRLPMHSRKSARNYFRSHYFDFAGKETVLIHPDGSSERMVGDTTGLNYRAK